MKQFHFASLPEIWIFIFFATAAPASSMGAPLGNARDIEFLSRAAHAFNDLAKKATPAVVSITTVKTLSPNEAINEVYPRSAGNPPFSNSLSPPSAQEQEQKVVGIGSGIVIHREGFILTNDHVVDHADRIEVSFDDKKKYSAHLIGLDSKTDLAVIQLDHPPKNLATLSFGDSEQIKVGDWAIAVGSPYGLKQSVTFGIISAKGRAQMGILDTEDFIQTDAAINPGSSGGPLLNTNGEIIGVNTAIFSQGGGFSGIGFAVPSQIAKNISDQLISQGKVKRGWLGLFAQDLNATLARHFHAQNEQGALVSQVVSEGPASRASIQAGDVILKYNSEPIVSSAQLKGLVGKTKAGDKIPVEITRDGSHQTLEVAVQEQPSNPSPQHNRAGKAYKKDASLGLAVDDIPPELASFLKISSKHGAIIVAVRPGSAGFDAGLAPGDIILDVDRKEVHGAKDFIKATSKFSPGDTTVFYVQHGQDDRTFVSLQVSP